jgi:exodeoxyribonuclease VII large subunit
MLRNYNQQLDFLGSRLETSAGKRLERMEDRLRLGAGKLHALSPLAVLSRGYAVVRDSNGKVVKRAADVAVGESVNVTLNEGEMICTKNS